MGPNTQLSANHSKRDNTNYVGSLNIGPFLEGWASNSAVVAAINKRSSKEEAIMHMLRSLFFIEAHHQFHSTAVHIAGSEIK